MRRLSQLMGPFSRWSKPVAFRFSLPRLLNLRLSPSLYTVGCFHWLSKLCQDLECSFRPDEMSGSNAHVDAPTRGSFRCMGLRIDAWAHWSCEQYS